MVRFFALAVVAAVMVGHPLTVQAHGVGSREMDPGAAKAMEFLYADGEVMAFAQVQVTAPDGSVHQSARTDARGRFAFVPTGPGGWSVAASDGQGHRAVAKVAVTAGQDARPVAAAAPRAPQRIGPSGRDVVLGVSLLANLFLLAAWRRARKGTASRT